MLQNSLLASVVWDSWLYTADEQVPRLRHTNLFDGEFVACCGRTQLYAYINRLGKRALFCDSDSIIFVQKDGEPPLVECGVALSDMTFQLKENNYISEFVSSSPKNCA